VAAGAEGVVGGGDDGGDGLDGGFVFVRSEGCAVGVGAGELGAQGVVVEDLDAPAEEDEDGAVDYYRAKLRAEDPDIVETKTLGLVCFIDPALDNGKRD
jgi:hypothetical protein